MNQQFNKFKTTFMLTGSSNTKLHDIMNTLKEEHDVSITKTDLLNMAISIFLEKLETEDLTIEDYLVQYNLL